jgi:hypothetical protein
MENLWNDTDRGKLTNLEKILSQCHSDHHETHTDWPEIETGPILCHGTTQLYNTIFKVVLQHFQYFHVFMDATRNTLREPSTSRS